MPTLEQLGSEKYVLLTTFRRDGRAVPTPVWVAPDGAELLVVSARDAGKVKRIRNSGRVTLAACSMRGRPRGDVIEATARIGGPADLARTRTATARKYWIAGRMAKILARFRQPDVSVAIVIT